MFYHLTALNGKRIFLNMNDKDLLTPEEAATYLSITIGTIYKYLSFPENPLPSYKISKKNIRIKKEELLSWVESYFKKPGDDDEIGGEQ